MKTVGLKLDEQEITNGTEGVGKQFKSGFTYVAH